MLLVIDVGNTHSVFALFNGETLHTQWRVPTHPNHNADSYKESLEHNGGNVKDITHVVISNVVPATMPTLHSFCLDYLQVTPLVVGEQNVNLGIEINVDTPSEVGADRLVNAVSAYRLYGRSAIIIDFGTATTFDVIDDKGNYKGGVIAPGINLSVKALHMAAAQLPDISVEPPANVIGTNTVAAMQSGIFFGYLSLIEGVVKRIRNEYAKEMITIATGGLAPLFVTPQYDNATHGIDFLEQDLTIQGLRHIHLLNQ